MLIPHLNEAVCHDGTDMAPEMIPLNHHINYIGTLSDDIRIM